MTNDRLSTSHADPAELRNLAASGSCGKCGGPLMYNPEIPRALRAAADRIDALERVAEGLVRIADDFDLEGDIIDQARSLTALPHQNGDK